MRADDPRHGTMRGYAQGCRDICCRRAKARYEKGRRYNAVTGRALAIPAIGTQRRIQALMALGWTTTDIAHACGWTHRNRVRQILGGQKGRPTRWVTRTTAAKVGQVYDRLSMTLPEMNGPRRRSRSMALRLGYAPPLAWDDIDTDPAPNLGRNEPRDLLAEWEHLRLSGESIEQAAKQLGVTVAAIQKAMERRREVA